MAVKIGSLRSDHKAQTDGDWEDIPELPGVKLRVRSFHYGPYVQARDQMFRGFRRKNGHQSVSSDDISIGLGELYAEHILLDWSGFVDDDGQVCKYSKDLAKQYLTDIEMRELRSAVEYAATHVGEAYVEVVADVGEFLLSA